MRNPTIYIGRELPSRPLVWLDNWGDPVDLTGYTIGTPRIVQDEVETTLTGAQATANANPSGDGSQSTDVASLTLAFSVGSLDGISEGPALLRIDATLAGHDRRGEWYVTVKP